MGNQDAERDAREVTMKRRLKTTKEFTIRRWVALLAMTTGVVIFIVAAYLGVKTEQDSETAAATIAAKDHQIADFRERLGQALRSNSLASREHLKEIATLRAELAVKDTENQRVLTKPRTIPDSSAAPPHPQTRVAVSEMGGISFELLGCRLLSADVTCDFLISGDTGGDIGTLCTCFAEDARDAHHLSSMVSLGKARDPQPEVTLVLGKPLKASITFGGIGSTSELKMLEVGFHIRRGFRNEEDAWVGFKNVPVSAK